VSLNSLFFYPPRVGAKGLNASMRTMLVGFASLYPPYPLLHKLNEAGVGTKPDGGAAAQRSGAISRVCHSEQLYRNRRQDARVGPTGVGQCHLTRCARTDCRLAEYHPPSVSKLGLTASNLVSER